MSAPFQHRRFAVDDDGNDLGYLLSLPDGYQDGPGPWPLLLFLHGALERGEDPAVLAAHGPVRQIAEGRGCRSWCWPPSARPTVPGWRS
ncbi:hypothetical protein [Kitasatospora sp. NPDC058046]|uniref:hypothetical protein n=1 Tax=Kitasatospora sp. NPDC058046 TaxID=3346312 RepID=UPI0036D7F9D5